MRIIHGEEKCMQQFLKIVENSQTDIVGCIVNNLKKKKVKYELWGKLRITVGLSVSRVIILRE
jgi:hypothetical protein